MVPVVASNQGILAYPRYLLGKHTYSAHKYIHTKVNVDCVSFVDHSSDNFHWIINHFTYEYQKTIFKQMLLIWNVTDSRSAIIVNEPRLKKKLNSKNCHQIYMYILWVGPVDVEWNKFRTASAVYKKSNSLFFSSQNSPTLKTRWEFGSLVLFAVGFFHLSHTWGVIQRF
jgi:hypothetical protein